MSREALADYVHPVLGVFGRSQVVNHLNELFVDLQKSQSTSIPGLGYEFPDFSIFLKGITEPPADMLADLVRLLQWPASRKHEVEARLFEYYQENRERFIEQWQDNGLDDDEIAPLVPELEEPAEVWKLIVRPRYISAGTWPEVSIAFDSTYDEEHELHISFADDQVSEIWDE